MQLQFYYHRYADSVVKEDKKFADDYKEIISVLESITERDLIDKYNQKREERVSIESLSEPLKFLIKERLVAQSWHSKTAIFRESPYDSKKSSRWRLDYSKDLISVGVAFNNSKAIAHNIMKHVLASEKNHVVKDIETKLGVIICATRLLKKMGNFDSEGASFEKFKRYFMPYKNLVPTPIVLIGLKETTSFYINKKTKLIDLMGR
jgi:hypothetical protein